MGLAARVVTATATTDTTWQPVSQNGVHHAAGHFTVLLNAAATCRCFYNLTMMRRFLIALFALHFLLSLGGFTLYMPSPSNTESALTVDEDGLGSSVQHGLIDDAPDLPDGPVQAALLVAVPHTVEPTTAWVFRSREDPTPWVRDRPPQHTA